jgi:hypothetical protein
VHDVDHEHAAMLTLDEAVERRFDANPWARDALARLGPDDRGDEVHDVAKGWLRIGGDPGSLVDTLFVLTSSRIGFAQIVHDEVAPQWIPLRSIVALDAIEGLAYPLATVEVQMSGDVAFLVGWPDSFCQQVVDVLTADLTAARTDAQPDSDTPDSETPDPVAQETVAQETVAHETVPPAAMTQEAMTQEAMPQEFADPVSSASTADTADLDELEPSAWQEPDVVEDAPGNWSTTASTPLPPPEPPAPVEEDRPFAPPRFTLEQETPAEPPTSTAPVPPAGLFGVVSDTSPFERSILEPSDDELAFDEGVEEPPPVEQGFEEDSPEPLSSFHSHTSALFAATDPEIEERVDAFFSDEHPEPLDEIAEFAQDPAEVAPPPPPGGGMTPAAFANRLIKWPEPFRSVTYLGENPSHPRRRKGVTLAFSPAGITAVSSGFSAWKHHIGWDEVTDLEFQGADEVKFTYDHRIDVNATAAIVGLSDGSVMVFEIKGRRPAMLRSSMAPVVNAVKTNRSSIHGSDSYRY